MRLALFLLVVTIPLYLNAQSPRIELKGVYQGESLFVRNPLDPGTSDFCTREVQINQKVVLQRPKASAYMIDLSSFKRGDSIQITIIHYQGCQPVFINPEVLRSQIPEFKVKDFKASEGEVSFATEGEEGSYHYTLYQFKEGHWIALSTLSGKGNLYYNAYSYPVNLDQGENLIRLKAFNVKNDLIFSDSLSFMSAPNPITFYPRVTSYKLILSQDVVYAVEDMQGREILRGQGDEIFVGDLQPGLYYLVVDHIRQRFTKK